MLHFRVSKLLILSGFLFSQMEAQNHFDSIERQGTENYESGNYPVAHQKFTELLILYQNAGKKNEIAATLRMMGENYRAMGEYDLALEKLNEALKISIELKNHILTGRIYNRLAAVYFEQTKPNEAEIAAKKSLGLAQSYGDKEFIANNSNLLGAILRSKKDFKGAIQTFEDAIKYYVGIGDTMDLPNVYNNIASTYLEMGNPDEAIAIAQKAFDISSKMGIKAYMLYAVRVKVEAFSFKGDYKSAFETLIEQNKIESDLFNESKSRQIKEINANFEMDKRNRENDNLQLKVKSQTLLIVLILIALLFSFALLWMASRRRLQMRLVNQKVEETNIGLERTNQMKDRLFSIISHDLRSPLNSIQGILSLVKSGNLSGNELNSITDSLIERVEYTSSLLENLLTWSRSQLQGFKVNSVQIDLQKIGQTVINQLQLSADKKKITIQNQMVDPVLAVADANMIEIVFRNLVSNAIKFTPMGGELNISAQIQDGLATVTVKDSGVGIKKENLEKLLGGDAFSTQGTANEKGSGLGLVLCKDFIEKNKGKMTATSNMGQGSSFTFSLPVE